MTDRALRLFESSREHRNERGTGREGRSLMVFYSQTTLKVVPVAMHMCLRVAGRRWNGKYMPIANL